VSAPHDESDAAAGRPSKSARKRTAHAAQNLGETLLVLADEELAALIQRAATIKEERHPMFVGMDKAMLPLHSRNMSEIGG